MLLEEGLRFIEAVVIAIGPWPSLLIIGLLVLIMFKKVNPKHKKG